MFPEIAARCNIAAKRREAGWGVPDHKDLKDFAECLNLPPCAWIPAKLWQAYETLEASKVSGHGGKLVVDLVSLIRFALAEETIFAPFGKTVDESFARWLDAHEASGSSFTLEEAAD